jgi:TldD protein
VKRREFIKTSTVLGAGVALLPGWWQACQSSKIVKGSVENMETLFGITKEKMKELLSVALSNGAEHADLYFEYKISSSLKFEDEIIKDVSHGIIMGLGVRAVKGEQIGYAHTDDLDFGKMKEAAKAASFIANNGGKAKIAVIQNSRKLDLYSLNQLSVDCDFNRKIRLINEVNVAVRGYDNKITKATINLADEMKQIMYMDSSGKFFTDVQPMIMLRASVVAEDGDKRQGGYSARGGRVGLDFYNRNDNRPADIGLEAAQIAVTNLEAVPAPAGPQIVVLGPAESGVLLHEAVGHGLEADFNRKNLSNYAGQIGKKVAAEDCTIIDSGIIPNLRGSINIDDEGNLPTESVLIENGVLRGYMHDSISAKVMKAAPTGNGRRQSYAYPPIPRMTNTYMRGGNYDPEEIIGSVKYGVYAKRFGGGQVDITKGDFTFGVYEAYLIENGKLTMPLKDVTLIGNGPEVMRNVTMVGNDPTMSKGGWNCGKAGQTMPVALGIPTVKVREITVGGTKA